MSNARRELNSSPPGLVSSGYSENAATLRNAEWHDIANLLGAHGYPIMLDLLLNCGLFAPVDRKSSVVTQISGE